MAEPRTSLEYVPLRILRICIFLPALLAACSAFGRGGGGCLEEGTLIDTPAGQIPIERLHRGDIVWAVIKGQLQRATVQATSEVEPVEYVEITVGGRTVRATAAHPFQIGPGTF